MNILRERMSRIALGSYMAYAAGWTMRVWRVPVSETDHYEPNRTKPDADITQELQKFIVVPSIPLDIAKAILALPRVNAVEVLDIAGFGDVLYKDWP